MSNDKETVKRTVSDDDNDQQLQDLSTHFLNLRLRDRNSQLPSEIEAFQNAAMALPTNFPADLPNEPTETNNRNNSNNGQGTIPRIYARTCTNSLSDTEIRTPRFRSNFARDLETNRESRRFTGNDFSNRNFNRQQQLSPLIVSKKGNNNILTIMDSLTRFGIAIPVPDTTARTIAEALAENLIYKFGAPLAILSDNGTNFMSKIMQNFAELFGLRKFNTSTYHPQGNAILERSHHNINEYIRLYISDKKDEWDLHINAAMFAYNDSPHSQTKISPHELINRSIARCPLESPSPQG